VASAGEVGLASPPGDLRDTIVTELDLDTDVVLFPLINRMGQVADLLDQGKEVDPAFIARGLELWKRYGIDVHPQRVLHVLGPISTTLVLGFAKEGRPKRGHGRGARDAANQTSRQELLLRDYQTIVHNQTLAESRIGELEMLRTLYSQQGFGARERLASVLKAFVLSEEAWARFEVDFVRKAYDPATSATVELRLRQGLEQVAAARAHLEPEVHAFVAEPIPTRGPGSVEAALGELDAQLGAVESELHPPRRGKPLAGT
jgi:hypothetical protein